MPSDALQTLRYLLLLIKQGLQAGLALDAELLALLVQVGRLGQFLGQVIQGVLCLESLQQQRFRAAVGLLGFQQAGLRLTAAAFQLLLLFVQRGLLLLMLANLFSQRFKLGVQRDPTRETMALRAQAFQLAEGLTCTAVVVPGLLRTVQCLLGRELFVTQTVQLGQPLLFDFQLPLLCLMGLELLLRIAQALLQFSQQFRGQRDDVAGLRGQGFQGVFGFLALAVGASTELTVDRGIGQLLQQLAALLVIRLEERAELALGEHHGAGELFEIQAQAVFDQLLEFAFALVAEDLLAVQISQGLTTGLQFFGGIVARAIGFPARAITPLIDADEVHLGVTAARTTAQQGTRVAGGDVAVDVRDLGLADVAQPRNRAEQRQAQGIEQGAFARAGRAGDGKQSGAGQRLGCEIDFKGAGQRGQVFQADGEDFHGCSLSCWTSRSSVAKSVSVCSSTSLPKLSCQARLNSS